MKRIVKGLLVLLCCMLCFGCSANTTEETKYADEAFVQDMAKGLQARWKLIHEDEKKDGYASI